VKPKPGKTKISIRLDNAVLKHFRDLAGCAGGGNYQTLINDALVEHIHRHGMLDMVRKVVREELAPYGSRRGGALALVTPPEAADTRADGRRAMAATSLERLTAARTS
jgi:hypothetical protein